MNLHFFRKPVPNCEKCRWFFILGACYCKAQGMKHTCDVYGNKYCRKLYEKKPEEKPEWEKIADGGTDNKILAIKAYRAFTGKNLREAKEDVEKYMETGK